MLSRRAFTRNNKRLDTNFKITTKPLNNTAMKRILILLCMSIGMYEAAFSQNKKGDILAGVYVEPFFKRLAVHSPPYDSRNQVNIRTNFKGGYYFFNRFSAGISAAYNNQSAIYSGRNIKYYNNDYMAGVFTRYVFPIKRFGIIAELGYRVGKAKGKALETENFITGEYIESNYNSGIRAYNYVLGFNYLVGQRLNIELLLHNETGKYNKKIFNGDYQPKFQNGAIQVGLSYYFYKEK
jgi:hypothetical protein